MKKESSLIPISKNTATDQLSESIAYCLLPVAFPNRSVAILNEIGIKQLALFNQEVLRYGEVHDLARSANFTTE